MGTGRPKISGTAAWRLARGVSPSIPCAASASATATEAELDCTMAVKTAETRIAVSGFSPKASTCSLNHGLSRSG